MNYARFILSSMFLAALFASSASAQAVRTFVASTGVDTHPCSRTAPCRTFQAAVNAAAAGGEVVALDSAGFGSNVAIGKPISIIAAPGVYAGITVLSGDGVDIKAGSSDTVVLRGLTIINQGGTGSGIAFNTGGTLHIENCVVSGFGSGRGVSFVPSASASLEVKDSIMRDNRTGIFIIGIGGGTQAVIDQVRVERGGDGIVAVSGAIVTVRNSIASGNTSRGFSVESFALSAEMNIEGCVASNNGDGGIEAIHGPGGAGATARVSNSTVTHNRVGFNSSGPNSVFLSRGNNTVEGNGTDTLGTIGSYSAK